jgi:hypothetical protein
MLAAFPSLTIRTSGPPHGTYARTCTCYGVVRFLYECVHILALISPCNLLILSERFSPSHSFPFVANLIYLHHFVSPPSFSPSLSLSFSDVADVTPIIQPFIQSPRGKKTASILDYLFYGLLVGLAVPCIIVITILLHRKHPGCKSFPPEFMRI